MKNVIKIFRDKDIKGSTSERRICLRFLLLVLICLVLSSCKVELYSNLTERQANDMLSVLLAGGVDSAKKSLGKSLYAILVEKSKLAQAVDLLNSEGLPGDQFAEMQDLYKKEGLISSPMEERVRYMFALSQSIAETLTNIDGVLTARVHVAVPEADKFTGELRPTSASVFIKYQYGINLDASRSEIKRIVESSIEGLDYQRIAVFMTSSVKPNSSTVEHKLVSFGPLNLSRSSVSLLKWLALSVLIIISIMLALIYILCSKLGFKQLLRTKLEEVHIYKKFNSKLQKILSKKATKEESVGVVMKKQPEAK